MKLSPVDFGRRIPVIAIVLKNGFSGEAGLLFENQEEVGFLLARSAVLEG